MSFNKTQVEIGLENVLNEEIHQLTNKRVGLICNQSSVNRFYQHAADLFHQNESIQLVALFGPQHGIRGDVQDNMVETSHAIDQDTGLPIYSLYSETRTPTEKMLANLDALVFDLQDVGCRVYTFIYTMANAMRACAEYGKQFIVLDRPNPIGGVQIEGNVLEKGNESFVGLYPIPMRHGLTVGELAQLFNKEYAVNCDLTVVKMNGWQRELYLDETDAPWVMPSPNMPTVETAVVFPATVYFEGTQVSEGRGTTRPFELVGAPYINAKMYKDALTELELPGVIFRETNFLPTFQKHHKAVCGGVGLHVTDRSSFKPVITGVAMVKTAYELYQDDFQWKIPPYEYVFDRNPFDVIAGTLETRQQIENNISLAEIESSWKADLESFEPIRNRYLLY